MRVHALLTTALTLGACLIQASPVLAQGSTVSDAECQSLRQKLNEHARGESVRVLEIISPVAGGVSVRRTVVRAQPNDQELWEETTTIVRPVSYWRTDVEVARSRETRSTSGTLVGSPSVSTPSKFSLER